MSSLYSDATGKGPLTAAQMAVADFGVSSIALVSPPCVRETLAVSDAVSGALDSRAFTNLLIQWWALQGLNLRPLACETNSPAELSAHLQAGKVSAAKGEQAGGMSSLPNSTASTTRIGAHRNNATATPRRAEAHQLAALAVEAAMLSEQIAEARR